VRTVQRTERRAGRLSRVPERARHDARRGGVGIGAGRDDPVELQATSLTTVQAQIDARVDEIAEFTELGDFLSLPIRTYSTGMRTRLAFAVSTSIEPDILLLDEGIGAGDASFLEKANKRLQEFTEKAAIIVLASHSEALIERMCDTAVRMESGKVMQIGSTDEVLGEYRKRAAKFSASA